MAFNDLTEYPRGVVGRALATDYTPFAAGTRVRIAWISLSNVHAATLSDITITDADGAALGSAATLITVRAGGQRFLGPMYLENGLKFSPSAEGASQHVLIAYFADGSGA
jgi:hypothetical protein